MTSIFKKQFYVFTSVMLLSIAFLCIGLFQVFTNFFFEQTKTQLLSQAEKIEEFYNKAVLSNGELDFIQFQKEMEMADNFTEQSFILMDAKYRMFWISSDIDPEWVNKTLDVEDLSEILGGNILEMKGNFGGVYSFSVYTIGYPIRIDGDIVGAVFVNAPMSELNKTIASSYRTIAIFTAVSVLIGFVLIYISSKKISRPIVEMNEAAKVIAIGDFEKRIIVNTDDEVGQLAHSFNQMANSLYLQEKSRREFLSNISHDLRSPLTSMRGFLQAILDGTIPDDKQERYLKIILDETDRLAKLAHNILDINKLEESENSLTRCDFELNDMLETTFSTFEERANKLNISLRTDFCEEKTFVNADYDKIQRVIYNLVDNSLKFTHKYGIILIKTEIKDKKVYISVKDNGKGVSPAEQQRVFERLYKADRSRGKDKKGSGLGLSIVKEFIKAHGETITLKSELGKGCEFIFTLPLVNR